MFFLSDPKDAANVRLNVAHEAQNEVMVVSYVFNPDRAGFTVLAELRDAARKGKRAVLAIDQFATRKMPRAMLSYLDSEGVEVYLFRPFWKNPLQYFNRMHVKLFIADGKHLVTGDSNISNGYLGFGEHAYLSRNLYVQGKAAQDARDYVNKLIASQDMSRFRGTGVTSAEVKAQKEQLDLIDIKKLTSHLREKSDWKKNAYPADEVEFFADPIETKGKVPGVEKEIIAGIDRAQHRIVFENAYVVLTDKMKSALERAARRGVQIRALTNSYESTNSKPVGLAWQKSRDFLASLGAEVWEHRGESGEQNPSGHPAGQMSSGDKFRKLRSHLKGTNGDPIETSLLHAKTLLIDDSESFITSYNLDPRSEKLNLETATRVKSKKFAGQLASEIQKDIVSEKYSLVASSGKLVLPDNSPKPSCLKKALLWIFESQL